MSWVLLSLVTVSAASGFWRGAAPQADGVVVLPSNANLDVSLDRLESSIDGKPPINMAFVLDHQANAESIGLRLDPTTLTCFGNPGLGTPIMQSNQAIALDFPLKMAIWTDVPDAEETFVAYNDPEYLKHRYQIHDRDAEFDTMSGALEGLAADATGGGNAANRTRALRNKAGLPEGAVVTASAHSVVDTVDRLIAGFEGTPMNVVARIDHAQAASDIGLDLRPTTTLYFGNPAVGTPFMVASQSFSLDLPNRAAVWEDEHGQVWVAVNDFHFLTARHGLDMEDDATAVNAALANFVGRATAP